MLMHFDVSGTTAASIIGSAFEILFMPPKSKAITLLTYVCCLCPTIQHRRAPALKNLPRASNIADDVSQGCRPITSFRHTDAICASRV